MKKIRVVVAGAGGMLGHMVLSVLASDPSFQVAATTRDSRPALDPSCGEAQWRNLDAETATADAIARALDGAAYVVNCIGHIKARIDDKNPADVRKAIEVNALFPYRLGQAAQACGARVLQIATDCVYSGERGRYLESDAHDALDVYGKTKSLGEARLAPMRHLRCSIVGPEPKGAVSLLGWFLARPRGAEINGFTNHRWNGLTTLHFAKICAGIMKAKLPLEPSQHVVPKEALSKRDLLALFAQAFGRRDIRINPVETKEPIDRSLATERPEANRELWKAAGYASPPTIPQMVEELARHQASLPKVRA